MNKISVKPRKIPFYVRPLLRRFLAKTKKRKREPWERNWKNLASTLRSLRHSCVLLKTWTHYACVSFKIRNLFETCWLQVMVDLWSFWRENFRAVSYFSCLFQTTFFGFLCFSTVFYLVFRLFLMATPTRGKSNTSSSIEEKELFLVCHEKAVSNNLKWQVRTTACVSIHKAYVLAHLLNLSNYLRTRKNE